jgi:hypothetical protein
MNIGQILSNKSNIPYMNICVYQSIKVKLVLGERRHVKTEREFKLECCLVGMISVFVKYNWVDTRWQ